MEVFGDNCCPPPCNTLGFLQKNNSLEEKGRLAGQKNLLSCDNSDRDARFRLTETDFSNLFARGESCTSAAATANVCFTGAVRVSHVSQKLITSN